MNTIDSYLHLMKIELVHFFGKTEEEADQMIANSKYFQSPATIPFYANPSTWATLIMCEKKTNE
jgi:small neutral amino acid transporter SnatA (MarC family)